VAQLLLTLARQALGGLQALLLALELGMSTWA
jgi:hypothetical protein